ncbi:DUF3883 domain-containing protein [Pedobacter sp. GSP4]|uniref:DUF3883 domain-containing protein n=1 Tax=Pedobacter sp. GSP4 TaxID=3453716 RepID=UPI003EE97596
MTFDWSNKEVELIVADYFGMLVDELEGRTLNKAYHRKALMPLLNNRSDGSVEFKHQNISPVLIGLGIPYIKGYKPRFNFQKSLLVSKVQQYLMRHPFLDQIFIAFADGANPANLDIDFHKWHIPAPVVGNVLEGFRNLRRPVRVNYLKREEQNRDLGLKGEEQVMLYEKFLLHMAGKDVLADKIELVSKDQGDGLGFDILSKNLNGTDKFIEVKTTKLGRESPFFFSQNEYNFSIENERNYHLYRVFDFNHGPKIFTCAGSFDQFCKVTPIQYSGSFI